ncbi:hypothetical protein MNBD_NITROSPIRAE02-1578 [hydrothermal vent metagenome]|uniref:Uncharacterized protein n=1 Tax=hydrothermal vent metagenome TaxID=652676 RepID=A0A3B1CQ66_9ZZZZ
MGIVCLNLKFTKDFNPGVKKAHTPAPLLIEGRIPALIDKRRNKVRDWCAKEGCNSPLKRGGWGVCKRGNDFRPANPVSHASAITL